MVCPQCGAACPDDATICTACGTALTPVIEEATAPATPESDVPSTTEVLPEMTPAAPPLKSPKRWVVPTSISLCLVLLATMGYALVLRFFPPTAPISALIPEECPVFATADGPWWWQSTQDIRTSPKVKTALQDAEKEMGLSVDKDVMPWVGRVGIAVFDMERNEPQMIVFAEVRNRTEFLKHYPQLQKSMAKGTKTAWTEKKYKGVTIRFARMDSGSTRVVSAGQVGGWLVVGIGENSIERAIDAWKGDTPSLQKNKAWVKAQGQLPKQQRLFIGMTGRGLLKLVGRNNPMAQTQLMTTDAANYQMATVMTDDADGLRFESISVANSDKLRARMKALAAKVKPVQGDIISQLPEGTVIAGILSNPNAWWELSKQGMIDSMQDPTRRMMMTQQMAMLKPFEEVLGTCTGEFGFSLQWRKQDGFGFALLGETESAANAKGAAEKLNAALVAHKVVAQKANGFYKIALPMPPSKNFKLMPCWTAKDAWLKFSSYPTWITKQPKSAPLQLPTEARGAMSVTLVNLQFLPDFLTQLEQEHAGNPATFDKIRTLHLETLQLVAYSTMAEDGATSHSVCELKHWDWRKAVAALPEMMEKSGQ